MRQWLTEAIDQIALGEILAESSLGCGRRFGLIAVDNSIEFMLVAYIEVFRRLVGGQKPGGIKTKEWEKKKRYFADLLSIIVSKEPRLSQHEDEINRYHDLRNDLYHTGRPRTVAKFKVFSCAKLAREVLAILFSISYDEGEWNEVLDKTHAALGGISDSAPPRRSVNYEQADNGTRYLTQANPTAKEAISLVLYGFALQYGREPSRGELIESLALSGYPVARQVLNSRLYELRRDKLVRKASLSLTARGRSELAKQYILP